MSRGSGRRPRQGEDGAQERLARLTLLARQLEERTLDLQAVCLVGRSFSAEDPAQIAESLAAAILDRLEAEKVAVLVRPSPSEPFRPLHAVGFLPYELDEVAYHPRRGILWQLMEAGEPFPVVGFEGRPLFPRDFQEGRLAALESRYWVPLPTRDGPVGLATLDRAPRSENETRFLQLLAAQAAVALENARLHQQLEQSRRDFKRQMAKLSMLYDVGRALTVIDNRNRLLREILGRAAEIAEAEKGSIMLLDEATDELVVQVVRGIDPVTEEKILNGEIQCKRLRRGEGIAGRVAETGQPLVVDDIREDKQFVDSQSSRVTSILCVPLKIHGELIGVLNITNKKGDKRFTAEDMETIGALAEHAAVAIHNARLYEMAVSDSLTRLYIRRHVVQRLGEELRRARRYGHAVSVLMLDIDHFKKVNDTYGHPCGDQALIEVSRLLRRSVRETDLVGRYGGEEFIVVLPETDPLSALVVAERIRTQLAASSFDWQGLTLRLTVSVGIAGYPTHASEIEALIQAADMALYLSKRGGRNRTTVFASEAGAGDEGAQAPVEATLEEQPAAGPGARA
ncbi:MAG TPA: sensor domain-containing diguanylate cyclase [Candidatus Nitrosotenuis sp.]|nr:sensor domain-containing diguanylate cyclase [Candidatus Nitrosotenuis sp.]